MLRNFMLLMRLVSKNVKLTVAETVIVCEGLLTPHVCVYFLDLFCRHLVVLQCVTLQHCCAIVVLFNALDFG